jgi:thymidylate synthase
MVAAICDLKAGEFVHTFGDAHLYANHFEQARTQLERQPKALAKLIIHNVPERIDDFRYEDFEIVDYVAAPHIAAPIAV